MTLEQVFPGLSNAPAGAVLAVANNLLDFKGPADDAQMALAENWSRELIGQIKAIDPSWHYDSFGAAKTFAGRVNQLNDLRLQRAAVIARVKGDYGPLQVETLRFVQERADMAYEFGREMLKQGRLQTGMTEPVTLGRFVDREVRRALRARYALLGIEAAGKGPVRVNRRENSFDAGLTHRIPDARVANVAFDVSLERKTPGNGQVQAFFTTDFRPTQVIIIRPRQLGPDHTYAISRPETKR